MKRLSVATLMSRLLLRMAACSVAENVRRFFAKGRSVNRIRMQGRFKRWAPCLTGNVQVDTLFSPARKRLASGVAPAALLADIPSVIASGDGLVRERSKPRAEMRPDDLMKCPADVHSRQTGPDSAVTHLAVTGHGK